MQYIQYTSHVEFGDSLLFDCVGADVCVLLCQELSPSNYQLDIAEIRSNVTGKKMYTFVKILDILLDRGDMFIVIIKSFGQATHSATTLNR